MVGIGPSIEGTGMSTGSVGGEGGVASAVGGGADGAAGTSSTKINHVYVNRHCMCRKYIKQKPIRISLELYSMRYRLGSVLLITMNIVMCVHTYIMYYTTVYYIGIESKYCSVNSVAIKNGFMNVL